MVGSNFNFYIFKIVKSKCNIYCNLVIFYVIARSRIKFNEFNWMHKLLVISSTENNVDYYVLCDFDVDFLHIVGSTTLYVSKPCGRGSILSPFLFLFPKNKTKQTIYVKMTNTNVLINSFSNTSLNKYFILPKKKIFFNIFLCLVFQN